jgi:hypothetical protein
VDPIVAVRHRLATDRQGKIKSLGHAVQIGMPAVAHQTAQRSVQRNQSGDFSAGATIAHPAAMERARRSYG